MASLENLVARYQRCFNDQSLKNSTIELEIRFQHINFLLFKTVYEALVAQEIPSTISHSIRCIKKVHHENHCREKILPSDNFYFKKQPLMFFKFSEPASLGCKVSLAIEQPIRKFILDSSVLVRLKNRTTFQISELWKIELTVVKQLMGSEVSAKLTAFKTLLFDTPEQQTAKNMMTLINPDDEYLYEIEIEYTGKPESLTAADVIKIKNTVLTLISPNHLMLTAYHQAIEFIASHILSSEILLARIKSGKWGLKRLLPQVKSMTKADYMKFYPPVGYYVTDKADGIRGIAVIQDTQMYVVADQLYSLGTTGIEPLKPTILDGEFMPEKKEFYGFDVIMYEGNLLTQQGFETRIEALNKGIKVLQAFNIKAEMKPFISLTSADPNVLLKNFESVFKKKTRPYSIDGIILVEPGNSYLNTNTFKWKPTWDNTLDFLVRKCPESLNVPEYAPKKGFSLHLLFVGISGELFKKLALNWCPGYTKLFPVTQRNQNYFPVQFQPSDFPLAFLYYHPDTSSFSDIDGKVLEMRCLKREVNYVSWEIVKIREDRQQDLKTGGYFGNDFKTAELTWLNYMDPFSFEELAKGPSGMYFAGAKTGIYRAQTALISFIKQEIIQKISHQSWVIDLGIGKGQDLGRYLDAGIRHLVGIDKDQTALAELIYRKFSHATTRQHKHATNIYVLHQDLAEPAKEISEKVHQIYGFPKEGASSIVSNLFIHYLMKSSQQVENLAVLCHKLLQPGGMVWFTTMLGERVLELLHENRVELNEVWEARENEVVKFAIKRLFKEDVLQETGQEIGVLLPFSNGDFYNEYLVNTAFLIKIFKHHGFSLVQMQSFKDWIPEFQTFSKSLYKILTEADKTWTSLFGFICLRKN
ncbi:hypothetical protein [African swine fever virus]